MRSAVRCTQRECTARAEQGESRAGEGGWLPVLPVARARAHPDAASAAAWPGHRNARSSQAAAACRLHMPTLHAAQISAHVERRAAVGAPSMPHRALRRAPRRMPRRAPRRMPRQRHLTRWPVPSSRQLWGVMGLRQCSMHLNRRSVVVHEFAVASEASPFLRRWDSKCTTWTIMGASA